MGSFNNSIELMSKTLRSDFVVHVSYKEDENYDDKMQNCLHALLENV